MLCNLSLVLVRVDERNDDDNFFWTDPLLSSVDSPSYPFIPLLLPLCSFPFLNPSVGDSEIFLLTIRSIEIDGFRKRSTEAVAGHLH